MNEGGICVSVCAGSAEEFRERIHAAQGRAEVVEMRFDCLNGGEREKALEFLGSTTVDKPIVVTFRSAEQGGRNAATIDERRKFWSSLPPGVWGVDLEEDAVDFYKGDAAKILSFHDFAEMPANVGAIFDRLEYAGADVIKIACQAHDAIDAIPLWNLIERARKRQKRFVPIAMGEAGKWTRILGPLFGAFMTYSSLDKAGETAPGQVSADDLLDIYRINELDSSCSVYGVIGDPISQSRSPFIQNSAFSHARLNAVFVPMLVKDIDAFMTRMVRPSTRELELNFGGFSVTMPHKLSIMRHLDEIDLVAREIGAVNTVHISDGRLKGYNTDAYGFIGPLKDVFGDLCGARVALCGAGGAARACAYALNEIGADTLVFARDENRAAALAEEFGLGSGSFMKLTANGARPGADFDILVNATPIGMKGPQKDATLFTAEQIAGARLVFDLVTSGEDTPLLKAAKAAGALTIGGSEMLLWQGAKQFEIWTGLEAPIDAMRNSLLKRI